MASNAWNTVGNIANVSGITGNVASGIVCIAAGYKAAAWGSPQNTLQNSWTKLQEIKDKLGAIPAERRQRIEAAATRGLCRSLKSIEAQFQECVPDSILVDSELTLWPACGMHTVH
jgi:hypothetical protein